MKYLLIFFWCMCAICAQAQMRSMTVASYNLRYDNAADIAAGNGWAQRLEPIASIIQFYDWDLFGTQEGLKHQLQQLQEKLPDHQYIGIGRDDGNDKGEHSAIFYRKNKFKVLKQGNFWLAPDTSKPNKGWDAALPRICTWALFQDIKNGFVFYCFNLHMDHQGTTARLESARLVRDVIRRRCGNTPVILMGDFNTGQDDAPYKYIVADGTLRDAYEVAARRLAPPMAVSGTFNEFNFTRCSTTRIDHIFVNKTFKVSRYGILTNTYNACGNDSTKPAYRFPSDHFPVMIVVAY